MNNITATNQLNVNELNHLFNISDNIICQLNKNGVYKTGNPSLLRLLDYSDRDLESIQYIDLIHPDDLIRTKKFLNNLSSQSSNQITNRVKTGNDSYIKVKWNYSVNEDSDNVLCIGHEVIDLEEKQEELQKAIGEVGYVKDALDQYAILATTDRKGKITYVNQKFCEISGYTEDELIGSDHRLLNSSHHPKEFWEDVWGTINSGSVWKGQVKNKKKDGGFYWVDTTIVPFQDKNGESFRFTAIRFEITDQKNLVDALERAKETAEKNVVAKTQFLANMSHEIRTPMNAIIGFTEILKSTYLTEEQQEFVDAIGISGENLLVIINDILDSSKIESNNISLEKIPVNIPKLLKQIKKTLKLKAEEKQLEFNVTTDIDVPTWVTSDPVRLNQILINLANNSIKFTEEGAVSISCNLIEEGENSCKLEFKVKDTGIGIPEDKLKSVFKRFQQAEDYTTRKYGGTGLGLSIAEQLTELFEGEIKVSSKVGVGTQFKVCIPFEIPSEAPNVEKEIINSSKKLENLRILLAEDNLLNQKLALNVMKKFKVDLTIVNNGQEAIDILRERAFDIILMDLQMPIMDGHTATKIIINELHIKTPIIAMTAHSLVGEKEKCIEIGMSDFLSKPYKANDLINILNKHKITVGLEESYNVVPQRNTSFDLSNLIQISGDDQTFVRETIELVIATTPATIEEIEQSFKEKNLELLKRSMHGIKPTIIMFNHAKIKALNNEIELSNEYSEIENIITELQFELNEFITNLKTEY